MTPLADRLRARIDVLTDERDELRARCERLEQARARVASDLVHVKKARARWRQRARDAEWGQQQLLRKNGLASLRSADPPLERMEPTPQGRLSSLDGSADLNDGKEIDGGASLTDRPGADAPEEVAA